MFSKSTTIISALGLAGTSLAAVLPRQTTDSWTLTNFTADASSGTAVHYTFGITENSTPISQCDYTIPGNLTTTYQAIACGDGRFSINQGYNSEGFIVVVPTDTSLNQDAFFGYQTAQLGTTKAVSPDVSEPSYIKKRKMAKRQSSDWTVSHFTRNCEVNPNECAYDFQIASPEYTGACDVVDVYAERGDDGYTQSWYGVPCEQNSNYEISWGYNSAYDSAIMTIKDVSASQMAFFGYNSVSNQVEFPNVSSPAVAA